MNKLFSLDNPVMQFLSRVADLLILNLLFLLCSVPVVTIGASLAAMNKVNQSIVLGEDTGIVKPFFHAFAGNFKQATLAWLLVLLFSGGLLGDYFLAIGGLSGKLLTISLWVLGVLGAVVLAVSSYYFQLIVRYENTMKQHLANALLLALAKLPITLLILALCAVPVVIFRLSVQVFFSTLIYWLLLGFSVVSLLISRLLKPVFSQMEGREENAQPESEASEE